MSKRSTRNSIRRISYATSVLLLLVFSMVSYRDAVQVATNRFYAPSVNPSGQEFKVTWPDTWSFLSGTTLKRIQCKIQNSQECSFLKPFRVPKQINTNFYNLISTETQLNAPERSFAAIDQLENGTMLILSKQGLISFIVPSLVKYNNS